MIKYFWDSLLSLHFFQYNNNKPGNENYLQNDHAASKQLRIGPMHNFKRQTGKEYYKTRQKQ